MTRVVARLLAVGMVLGFAAALQAAVQDDLSTAPRIWMAEFEKLLDSGGVVVIDVRDPVSYGVGHIPGAILVPLETLQTRLPELKAETKPIVTYCA